MISAPTSIISEPAAVNNSDETFTCATYHGFTWNGASLNIMALDFNKYRRTRLVGDCGQPSVTAACDWGDAPMMINDDDDDDDNDRALDHKKSWTGGGGGLISGLISSLPCGRREKYSCYELTRMDHVYILLRITRVVIVVSDFLYSFYVTNSIIALALQWNGV